MMKWNLEDAKEQELRNQLQEALRYSFGKKSFPNKGE